MTDETTDIEEDEGDPPLAEAPVGAILGGVAAFLSSVGVIWTGLLMLLIVADVLGRNFLDRPITGVSEIAARSVVAIVFLQVGAAVLHGRLTRADFLLRRIGAASARAVHWLDTGFALTGAAIFGLVLWATWPPTVESLETHEFFGVQGVYTIPTFPFWAIIVLGAGVAAAACLYQAVQHARAGMEPGA